MKYLKLFENFNVEDTKWIIISALDPVEVDEIPTGKAFDEKFKDTSMFQIFELSDKPNEDKVNHLKSWLREEGYYSIIKNNKVIITDKPIKDVCIEWLNTNYSGMEAVNSNDYPGSVFYRYKPKNNILIYDKEKGYVWVRDEIWLFFENELGLDKQVISGITEEWLSETYNLSGISTISGYGYILPLRNI